MPDYEVHAAGFIPNDPGKEDVPTGWQQLQWNFADDDAGVNAPDAWDYARQLGAPGGRGVTVAVIDSGVAYERHGIFRPAPDLYSSRFVKPYDFVDNDRHPNDEESHGTHVTGTIAQKTNNGFGVTGLAYGVKIMPLRVLNAEGGGRASYIARAIRYAARNGADVINMSVEFDLLQKASGIPEVISAIRYAHKKNVVMVAASGNDYVNRVTYPAKDQDVIAVGATTDDACKADYSNTGKELDIVAPGGGDDAALDDNDWDRTHCDPASRGRGIWQETFTTSYKKFGLVERRGDVVCVTARDRGGGAADRHGAARAASVGGRGRGAAEGDGAGYRAGGARYALRRGAAGCGGGVGAGSAGCAHCHCSLASRVRSPQRAVRRGPQRADLQICSSVPVYRDELPFCGSADLRTPAPSADCGLRTRPFR